MSDTVNDRRPNFRDDGHLFLVRCFACPDAGERGKENWAMAVSSGYCARCGWSEQPPRRETDDVYRTPGVDEGDRG